MQKQKEYFLTEGTAKKFNELARHQQIYRLLADVRVDFEICEIEGWDKREYLNQLIEIISGWKEKIK